jgi:hypothetical protein
VSVSDSLLRYYLATKVVILKELNLFKKSNNFAFFILKGNSKVVLLANEAEHFVWLVFLCKRFKRKDG